MVEFLALKLQKYGNSSAEKTSSFGDIKVISALYYILFAFGIIPSVLVFLLLKLVILLPKFTANSIQKSYYIACFITY